MRLASVAVASVLGLSLSLAGLAACGPAGKRAGRGGDGESAFQCNGRHAAYIVTGSIAAAEAGVRLFCDGDIPMVEHYTRDDGGAEKKTDGRISPEGWNEAWMAFENGGWRQVGDCDDSQAGKKDPFYVFEIADEDKQVSLTCKGATLPYPFDTFRDNLDRAKGELPVDETSE